MSTSAHSLIAAHMRAAAARRPGSRVGPFTVGLDPHTDDPMRNFAVPDAGARPDAGEVGELTAFFRRHQRIPRLEYVEASAPAAWPALAAAGFVLDRRTPVMISVPGTELTPRPPAGIIFRRAAGDADLAAAAAVQHEAYELPAPPGPHDIARLSGLTQRGGLVGVAVDEVSGAVVAAGLIDVAGERPAVGELAAVGVLAAFRRRGIAAAIAAHLAGAAHADGIGLVFLEAEPDEERIYRRTGFLDAAAKIWASLR